MSKQFRGWHMIVIEALINVVSSIKRLDEIILEYP